MHSLWLNRKDVVLSSKEDVVILIIESGRGNSPSFSNELMEKGYQVTKARSGIAGLAIIDSVKPHALIIDAASLRTSGARICQSFRVTDELLPIILIIEKDQILPKDVNANLVLKLPFTVQKLINRLRAYHPTDDKYILKVGPIELNTRTKMVNCNDKQTKLTPRMVNILQLLMENKGKIVQREPLFKKIWDTNYTGDTRTLDVHISWIRQAIEKDPRNPKLIKTERGVGYILEV